MNSRPIYAAIFWFIIVFLLSRICCDATPGESCIHGGIGAVFGFLLATVILIGAHVLYYRRTKKRMKAFEEEDKGIPYTTLADTSLNIRIRKGNK